MSRWDRFLTRHSRVIEDQYERFRVYRGVSQGSIYNWIRQFRPEHWALALKVLTKISFFSLADLDSAFKSIHHQLLRLVDHDLTYVYFAPLGDAGTSAEAMRYYYKVANIGEFPDLEAHLIRRSEISSKFLQIRQEHPRTHPVIVFIDDICGTGDEALDAWKGKVDESFPDRTGLQEIVPPDATVFFAFAVAFESARARVVAETDGNIRVLSWIALRERERLLSDENHDFSKAEKSVLKKYCESTGAGEEFVLGWKRTASLVVFEHNCPDNSISILWWRGKGKSWKGLFQRY